MYELIEILSTRSFSKLQFYLNRTKDIVKILKTPLQFKIDVKMLGEITNMSILQYVLTLMMSENDDGREELKRIFFIVLKEADQEILEMTDCNGNNILFYAAIVADNDILKCIMDRNVQNLVNQRNQMAHEFSDGNVLVFKYAGIKAIKNKRQTTNDVKQNEREVTKTKVAMADGLTKNKDFGEKSDSIGQDNNTDLCDECKPPISLNLSTDIIRDENKSDHIFVNKDICLSMNNMCSENDLLDMKPNKNETDNKKTKPGRNMSNDEREDNESNEEKKDSCLDTALNDDISVDPCYSKEEVQLNFKNTIKSMQQTKHISEKDLDEAYNISEPRSMRMAPSLDSSNESECYRSYKEEKNNHREIRLQTELVSDSTPDYFDYAVSKFELNNLQEIKYNEFKPREVHINKFPGVLFVYIDTITNYFTTRNDIESVAVKIVCNSVIKYTDFIKPDGNIEFSQLLRFPIKSADVTLKFYFVIKFCETTLNNMFPRKKYRKILEGCYNIDANTIIKHHNMFAEKSLLLKNYKSKNLITNFKDIFSSKLPNADTLKTFITYVSKPELPEMKQFTVENLVKFLIYRQNSTIFWYNGYANVRGECPVATHLWKRRLIEWHGYNIIIFNEFSYKLVGVFDLSNCKYLTFTDDVLEYCVKIVGKAGVLELQLDCEKKFEVIKDALNKCLDPILH